MTTHTEESSPELLACPFPHEIKRGVFLEVDTVDFGFVRGACSDCGCAGPYVTLGSCERVTDAERAEATKLWNARAALASTPAKDEVERLREALEDIREAVAKRQLPLTDQIYRRADAALNQGASHA